MGYKVITRFKDLCDSKHQYNVGDDFPRVGATVSEARINELISGNNKMQKPLIEEIKDDGFSLYMNVPEQSEEQMYTKTDINRMSTKELRELASKHNIDNADKTTGSDLKKILIEKLGL